MGERPDRLDRRASRVVVALTAVAALVLGACSSATTSDADGAPNGAPGTSTTSGTGGGTNGSGGGATPGTVAPSGPLDRYAEYVSVSYDDPTHWVCRPEATDICATDLDTTVIEPDGTATVEPFVPADDPTVDCFYVYPTISRDTTPFSDWNASPEEEGYVTLHQAARLRSVCRVFAPVYRQATLTSLLSRMSGGAAPEGGEVVNPYDDVLDAFRTYMANDNDGRGVVLIGHSQGAGLLTRLVAEEIDPNPDVREKLVSAFLAGSSVTVPEGADVGGSFQAIPVCRAEEETGCVVTWSSFRSTAPPTEGALFGRPRGGEGVAACANPAALDGGPAPLQAYFPATRDASILDSLGAGDDGAATSGWTDPPAAVTTPFVSVPGLVTGACVSSGGFTYLSVSVNPDAGPRVDDITGDLAGGWGLHLVDISLVMGDVVDLVGAQAEAYGSGS